MAVILTKEDILNARTYMPITMKRVMTKQIAEWCTEEKPDKLGKGVPPLYCENRELRQLFLYGLLARWYLRKDFACGTVEVITDGERHQEEVDYYMAPADYDEWAGSHVMNQLERMKRDRDVADKIYDLLYDFRALETLSYGAVRDELEQRNDLCARLGETLALSSDPDTLRKNLEEIVELGNELNARKEGSGETDGE